MAAVLEYLDLVRILHYIFKRLVHLTHLPAVLTVLCYNVDYTS